MDLVWTVRHTELVGSYVCVQFDVDPNENQDLADVNMLNFRFDIGWDLIDLKVGRCRRYALYWLPVLYAFCLHFLKSVKYNRY